MRKLMSVVYIVALLFGITAAMHTQTRSANAQEGGELVLGEWVEGEITAASFEHPFTFTGTAGDIILVEMYNTPGEYGLDPYIEMLDSAGEKIADNDDFISLGAVVLRKLAADAEYTIVAGRSSGADGSSEGTYVLRASVVELSEAGLTSTVTFDGSEEEQIPELLVLRSEEDTVLSFGFAYETNNDDLYPEINLKTWTGENYEDTQILNMYDTSLLVSGTMNVKVKANTYYVYWAGKSTYSYVYDETAEGSVTLTVNSAE